MTSSTARVQLALLCLAALTGCWAPTAGEIATADYGLRPSDALAQTMSREWIDANLVDPEGALVSYGTIERGWFRAEGIDTEVRYGWKLHTTINERNTVGGFRGAKTWEFFFRGPYLVGVGKPVKRLGSRGRYTVIQYTELEGADGIYDEPVDVSPPPAPEVTVVQTEWHPHLSLPTFQRILVGMSYPQVVEIMGGEGEVHWENVIGTTQVVLRAWESRDGTRRITGLFHDDLLRLKTQEGLE